MRLLIDSSVLLWASQPDSYLFEHCVRAVEALPSAGFAGFLIPQVVYDYWADATRPVADGGLGMPTHDATLEVAKLATMLPLLRNERGVFEQWQVLVTRYGVDGTAAHDARLVAAMLSSRLTHLLTLVPARFACYREIAVLSPDDLVRA